VQIVLHLLDRVGSAPWAVKLKPVGRWVLRGGLLVLVLALLWVGVSRQWADVRRVIGDLSGAALGSSLLFALAGTWFGFLSWRALLADFGSAVPLTGAMRIFFVGQLGKYVPGKVWQVLAQVRLGRPYQVPGRTSAAAAAIVTLISLGAGLLVTVLTLPALGGGALASYWWALLVLPLAIVALWPPVLNRLLAALMRMLRREPMPQPLSLKGIGRAVGWAMVMWLCYGVHLWVLLGTTGLPPAGVLVRAIGAFAGSWAIGFLLVFAPAGLGPRELSLALLLGATVAAPVALAAALISRLMLTLADVAWPAVAVLLDHGRGGTVAVTVPAELVSTGTDQRAG
jgi:uncharacterized membrane protein YbhN (UPF0104 family)